MPNYFREIIDFEGLRGERGFPNSATGHAGRLAAMSGVPRNGEDFATWGRRSSLITTVLPTVVIKNLIITSKSNKIAEGQHGTAVFLH